ncbi:hypothetical protein PAEPH01_2267 [Pancytospora epiphaga]|nr:hypothetical protein PAEPH01_2267 [Pancytospora epiphaga]
MHPKEFKGYLDHIADMYSGLYDEVVRLKRENKGLNEEVLKRRHVASMAPGPRTEVATQPTLPKKIIKMGSDWHIEGDRLLDISLIKRLKFPAPICNAKISKGGKIAFSCNKRVFLYFNNKFYLIEDSIREYDPEQMKNDLTENFRCIFDFDGESLLVFFKNNIFKYENNKLVWSFPLSSAYHMMVSDGLLYVGTRDYKVLVFREKEDLELECVKVYEYTDAVKFFTVVNGGVVAHSDYKVGILGTNAAVSESTRILALDAADGIAYYGGESLVLKISQVNKNLDVTDTVVLKKAIFAIKTWGPYLLVACQDKSLSIWNLKEQLCMKVVGNDNIVDVAANEQRICCVDNNGSLRIWEMNN